MLVQLVPILSLASAVSLRIVNLHRKLKDRKKKKKIKLICLQRKNIKKDNEKKKKTKENIR